MEYEFDSFDESDDDDDHLAFWFGEDEHDQERNEGSDAAEKSESQYDALKNSVIFKSLLDSDILRKLSFHKEAGDYRLPRIRRNKSETYESLYRLLEELLMLLNAWYKRTRHPFASHLGWDKDILIKGTVLKSKSIDKSKIKISCQDYESEIFDDSESEEEEEFAGTYGETCVSPNEELSMIKFSDSSKAYYEIFENHEQFEEFLASVRQMKSFIMDKLMRRFRKLFPNQIARKLPNEICLKIWKYTQSHSCDDEQSFHLGYQSNDDVEVAIEKERITELFGSIGNMHMLIFEFLFKKNVIRSVCDLYSMDDFMSIIYLFFHDKNYPCNFAYDKLLFLPFRQSLKKHFCRLRDFLALTNGNDVNDEEKLLGQIDQGRFYLTKEQLQVNFTPGEEDGEKELKETFLFPEEISDVIAYYKKEENGMKETRATELIIYNVRENRKLGSIHVDIGNRSLRNFDTRVSLTKTCFAVFLPMIAKKDSKNTFVNKIVYWKFDQSNRGEFNLRREDAREISFEETIDRYPLIGGCNFMKASEDENGQCVFLIIQDFGLSQYPTVGAFARFFDSSTGAEIPEMHQHLDFEYASSIEWFKGSAFMLKRDKKQEFYFHHSGPSVITHIYDNRKLCKTVGHKHSKRYGCCTGCEYQVLSDYHPQRKQFLFFTQSFHGYILLSYDESLNSKWPVIIAKGSVHIFNLGPRFIKTLSYRKSFMDGVLFVTADRQISLFKGLVYEETNTALPVTDITAIDCVTGKPHRVVSLVRKMNTDSPAIIEVFDRIIYDLRLNDQSRLFHLNIMDPATIHFTDPSTLNIIGLNSLTRVSFESSGRAVLEADINRLGPDINRKKRLEKEKRILAEQRMIAKKRAIEAFANTNTCLEGKIVTWKNSFGFIKPHNKVAKDLGQIFFHVSKVISKPRGTFIRPKKNVLFKVARVSSDRIQAVEVSVLN